MQIRLSINFEPYTPDWSAYCDHALQSFRAAPSGVQITTRTDIAAFILTVPGLPQPAYFKAALPTDAAQALMHRWAANVGTADLCLTPRIETSKKWNSGAEVLFLAVYIEGPDREVGVFRLCSQLVHNAERLTDADLLKLRDLVAKVT